METRVCENREVYRCFVSKAASNSAAPIREQRVRNCVDYHDSACYRAEQRKSNAAIVMNGSQVSALLKKRITQITPVGEQNSPYSVPRLPTGERKRRFFYENQKRNQSLYCPRGHDHERGRRAAGRGIRLEPQRPQSVRQAAPGLAALFRGHRVG